MSSSSPTDGDEGVHAALATEAHSDTSVAGKTPASNRPRSMSRTPSPLLLPPNIDEASPEPPDEDLHLQYLQSTAGSSHSTPHFFSALQSWEFPSPSPTWDTQCECGGISPHYHGRGRLLGDNNMNGTHAPTAPRGAAGSVDPDSTTVAATPSSTTAASSAPAGQPKRAVPLSNHVQVARSYVFEQEIQQCLRDNGVSQAREDNIRLAGVQWIDSVRRALKLPVRTFNTAVVYYHKFRLQHSDGEYSFVDASAAALFAACKIEDTLKKSRDILCAAHNLKAPRNEQLSPDDQHFEHPSRTIIGLERLMLEASGFDFRNRHPQDLLIKFLKHYSFEKTSPTTKLAYTISLDLYRTWAPLKQTTAVMAFACLELAGRLLGEEHQVVWRGTDYTEWRVERGMVMETLLDLLELYTHHRAQSVIGPEFPVDRFLEVRIPLNQESDERRIPRFTGWVETKDGEAMNGVNGSTGVNGAKKIVSPRDVASPRRGGAGTAGNVSSGGDGRAAGTGGGVRQRVGERGREGTVRFILNPDRAREEKAVDDLLRKP